MDHGKRRGSYRVNVEADQVDLGHEPPLSVDGETSGMVDRRRVSVQWFSGTILTGLCGAALMGGAVFASLDGESNFATVPERVQVGVRGAGDRAGLARKADRLPPPSESNNMRSKLRVSTTSRVGNREVVRARQVVRVAGNLALSVSEMSANIPPFNPQKMLLAEAAFISGNDNSPDGEVDAEVSFVTRDLAGVFPRAKVAAVLGIDDVLAQVREVGNWTGSTPRPTAPEFPRNRLAYAARRHSRSLCRLRVADGAGKRHARHQDPGRDHRWQRLDRADSAAAEERHRRDGAARCRRQPRGCKGDHQLARRTRSRGRIKEGQAVRVLLAPTADAKRCGRSASSS